VIATGGTKLIENAAFESPTGAAITAVNLGEIFPLGR
jgi:hypothetical protein